MAGRAAKNLALQLATGIYKGVNKIGRGIKSVVNRTVDGMERVHKAKEQRNIKMIEENFGNVENYQNLQK